MFFGQLQARLVQSDRFQSQAALLAVDLLREGKVSDEDFYAARHGHQLAYAEYAARQRFLALHVPADNLGMYEPVTAENALNACCGHLLTAIGLHARRLEPVAVRSLIEPACAVCDFIQLKVAFLRLLRAMDPDPAAQKGIDRRIVTAMIADADRSTGALRQLMLTDAATVARDAGLTDLSQDVTRKIQAMRRDDLGLVALGSVRVQLSQQELDAARAEVDQAASLAKRSGGSLPHPRRRGYRRAQQAAQILTRTAPLASSIPRGRINPVGPVPVSPASSDPLASTQARFQVLYLNRRGLAIALQLDRVRERFDPDEGDLTAVFAHDAIGSASKTGMLVHAFRHFWAGQDDAAVHLALPRVEDLLREIERSRNVPVVSVAQGRTPGGMSQLGSLIAAMPAAGFDQNWTRSFELLLTDGEHGLNLRNEVGHGLCDCPPRHHVALVLHAALFLLAVVHGVIALPRPAPALNRSCSHEDRIYSKS